MDTQAHILIVDDEPGIRLGCRRALEPAGYRVDEASSFKHGKEKLASAIYDLILLDVMLPDGRGIDLLPDIIAKDPATVTIIVTGYATVEMAVSAIKHGAYDFISKPFTSDLLLLTVQQGLEKRHLSLESQRLKQVETKAAEMARQKAEAERLGAFKAQFALTVAHELRAPVAGAQSLLRTLTNGLVGEFTEKQSTILERLEARLDELLTLINDLLTLAKSKNLTDDTPIGKILILPVIQKTLSQFEALAAEKNIHLHMDELGAETMVYATEDGLVMILTNLFSNAIKYSKDEGNVWVKIRPGYESVQIEVKDDGIGIPQDALQKIGQEFFRAPNAQMTGIIGTGLGLSIVRQYLTYFGGEFSIDSQENKGTTVAVKLRTQNSTNPH
jgi:two-component system, sensor histidine kinase and response regulator